MTYDEINKKLKSLLHEKRYIHSVGVSETAVKLARIYGADEEKAKIAGLVHDAAKNLGKEKMFEECKKLDVELDEIELTNTAIVHASMADKYVRREFDIDDKEILSAVRYHTTGRANMTLLEKIIYISDMVEPNRDYVGVEKLRDLVEKNLDRACIAALAQTISFTIGEEKLIHPNTIYAYNDLLMKNI